MAFTQRVEGSANWPTMPHLHVPFRCLHSLLAMHGYQPPPPPLPPGKAWSVSTYGLHLASVHPPTNPIIPPSEVVCKEDMW